MRRDWSDNFQDEISPNLSITYPKIVRAWHRHERGQVDYFVCIRGAIKICDYDDKTQELTEIVSTGENPQVVGVPGHYWHGFKALGVEPAMLVYFVNRLYDYENPNEVRRPWNDPKIMPKVINGKKMIQDVVSRGIGSIRRTSDYAAGW